MDLGVGHRVMQVARDLGRALARADDHEPAGVGPVHPVDVGEQVAAVPDPVPEVDAEH